MKKYMISLKWPLALTSFLFVSMCFMGYLLGEEQTALRRGIVFFEGFQGYNPLKLFILIFLNNSVTSLAVILLGVIFAIFPVLVSARNGLLIGIASFQAIKSKGLAFFLMRIMPHGVIEAPMILLSTAIGIKIGHEFYKKVGGSENQIKEGVRKGLKVYVFLILPLLILAAFIEVFIEPLLIE